jgi:hypothetical protein
LPGFDISLWHGLWLPKGTPKNIVAKVNVAVMDALADPMVSVRLAEPVRRFFCVTSSPLRHLGPFREVVADHQGGQHQGRIGRII